MSDAADGNPHKLQAISDLDDLTAASPDRLWLRPLGLLSGAAADRAVERRAALPLAGGGSAFALVEILARAGERILWAVSPLAELHRWAAGRRAWAERIDEQLARLSAPRPAWAGLRLDRPLLMGIVNVTPDSFSDGGDFFADPAQSVAHGRALAAAGADIIDVGGESTRPGAAPVAPEEEIRRVEPVVRGLAAAGALVSIDTRHAPVMAAAVAAGARIINDISALSHTPDSPAVAARTGAAVVLMHMQGEPATMQKEPSYTLPSLDIVEYLAMRIDAAARAGIPRERIVVDPGIGFGKRSTHNLEIMGRLALFHALGCGVLLGVSRKSLIGALAGRIPPNERLPGSLAGALQGVSQGAQILRVHDVAETRQALAIWQAAAAGA